MLRVRWHPWLLARRPPSPVPTAGHLQPRRRCCPATQGKQQRTRAQTAGGQQLWGQEGASSSPTHPPLTPPPVAPPPTAALPPATAAPTPLLRGFGGGGSGSPSRRLMSLVVSASMSTISQFTSSCRGRDGAAGVKEGGHGCGGLRCPAAAWWACKLGGARAHGHHLAVHQQRQGGRRGWAGSHTGSCRGGEVSGPHMRRPVQLA